MLTENLEDAYEPPAMQFPGLDGEIAYDPRPISANGSKRIIDMAFDIANERKGAPGDGVNRVTCVDKSNVTEDVNYSEGFAMNGEKHPDKELDYSYIDAFMQWITRNPEHYNVVVTSNMFGDISTDLGAYFRWNGHGCFRKHR